MSGRLILLGTGTCQLHTGRAASAVLVELPATRFVYDFGHGVGAGLATLGLRQDDLQHIVLSHFHPDHFSDLIPYLHAALWAVGDQRTTNLHIYGPPGLHRLMELVEELVGFGADAPFSAELHTLTDELLIGELQLEAHHLPPAGNHGLRFLVEGQLVALTGDSHFHDEEVAFIRDADLAVIDAGHLEDEEIVELAVQGQPKRLVCSHLYRELDIADLDRRALESGYRGRLIVAEDMMEFPLGARS